MLIHGSDCSKECQVEDWKDHKTDCGIFRHKEWEIERKFTRNFLSKHQNLLAEKVKAASVAAGLETMELIIHLDFRGSGHYLPPSLRDPPVFEIAPAQFYFYHYGKEIVSENCFF